MTTTTISIRDLARNSKEVFEHIKETGQPAVVINRKEPQVVIVRLEDFRELEQMKRKHSAKAALQFVHKMRQMLEGEDLPRDLSKKHDYYLWEDDSKK